jgi:ubiquinone/menaquinone biosynthesis C-methylase UbiE
MRAVAEREHAPAGVSYLDGSAEAIPLPDASCDAALLSHVIHHVEDRAACTSELRRVVRPGGLVLARGVLGGRSVPFHDFFPSAQSVDARRTPSVGEVVAMFSCGFDHVASEVVDQETSPSLRDYYERVSLRAISTLELIGDEEFEQGIERMRRAAEDESEPASVIEQIDLVVFRRRP